MVAAIRPDSVSIALLVHIVGAMVLMGGLVTGASALLLGWRDWTAGLLRVGYFSLLALALPGWIVMRIGAQWTENKENFTEEQEEELAWLGIGIFTANVGGLLLLAALIAGGIGVRQLREGRGTGLLKFTAIASVILVAAYVVAVWAMAAKPE
jgi:hypothetical protein